MRVARHLVVLALSCWLGQGTQSIGQATSSFPATSQQADQAHARRRLAVLDERIRADPANATLLLERAEVSLNLENPARMREDLEKAVLVDPKSAETWIAAGEMMRQVDAAAAIPYFDRAVSLAPRNAKALHLRGLARAVADRLEDALVDVDAALDIAPTEALTHGLKGNILMRLGRFDDAIDALSRSLAIEPLPQVYFDRGFCLLQRGDPAHAIEDYSAALRLDDSRSDVFYERGVAYQKSGDFRRAIADLERMRRSNPDDPRAPLLLAWIYATATDERVRDGRKALAIAGDLCDPVTCQTAEPLNALAAAYAELGDFEKATKLQERAVALSHFAPEFHAASQRRLESLRQRKPIREAGDPLLVLPRAHERLPRAIDAEEAAAAPPDVLAAGYLQVRSLLQGCDLARAGAVIHADLDGLPLTITSDNAEPMRERLVDRRRVYDEAIRRRGFTKLAEGYRSRTEGGCDEWGLGEAPTLVEQDLFDVHLTQGDMRHVGVVVESAVVFEHAMNSGVMITGFVEDDTVVFVTPQRYGITGMAHERCTLTLIPVTVEGPEWAQAFVGRALARRASEAFAPALADLDRAIEIAPSPQLLALRAYALATCPDDTVRDGRRAVESATRALELTRGEPDVDVLDAAAVAAAEAGDFAGAVAYQRRALGLATEENRPALEARLRLFESRRAYHEERVFPEPPTP